VHQLHFSSAALAKNVEPWVSHLRDRLVDLVDRVHDVVCAGTFETSLSTPLSSGGEQQSLTA